MLKLTVWGILGTKGGLWSLRPGALIVGWLSMQPNSLRYRTPLIESYTSVSLMQRCVYCVFFSHSKCDFPARIFLCPFARDLTEESVSTLKTIEFVKTPKIISSSSMLKFSLNSKCSVWFSMSDKGFLKWYNRSVTVILLHRGTPKRDIPETSFGAVNTCEP